jgi:DNA-binding PadR family transcriptional regulator
MGTELLRGHLDMLLLGLLRDRPRHGYEVITALRERSDGVLDMTEGAVYPALHRLEARGLLSSEWVPVSGRRRRVYEVTEDGLAALAREGREWRRLTAAVDAVLGASELPARVAVRPGWSPA